MSPARLRFITLALLSCAGLVAMATACGPSKEERRLAFDVQQLETDRLRLRSELATYNAIVAGEKSGTKMVLSTVKIADLEKALRKAFPISFPASKLSGQVSGDVIISKLSRPSLKNGVMKFQLSGRGRKIKLRTAVPPGYQTMARELVSGIQSGLTLDVEGEFYIDKGKVYFSGRTTKAKLRKHAKRQYHNMIVSGVNGQLFQRPHPVSFDRLKVGRNRLALNGLITETNRLVFVFK